MSGTFVAVVGPSGVGKDSLIAYARDRISPIAAHFVRRVVTRSADAGSEDHDSLTPEAFDRACAGGQFALNWEAHGLRYGLPTSLEDDLESGKVVVANLSRAVIPAVIARYPGAVVVEVTAEREVIAARLKTRGRETADTVATRLKRSVPVKLPPSTIQIDNSGALAVAGEQFLQLLRDLARQPSPA